MTKAMRLLTAGACLVLVLVGFVGTAHGFFPKGGFNLNQQIRYATWPFRDFDTNNNGVIEKGEGLEFRIESGPRGFSPAEIEQVKEGFQVWEDVPTSYAAFRFAGLIEDPIMAGTLALDYLPMVFMQVDEVGPEDGYSQVDDDDYAIPGLSWAVPAITMITYTIDTSILELPGRDVIVPAETILDCDIVVNASMHRADLAPNTSFGTLDLQATIAHSVGHLLGLAYTPLNNLDPYNDVLFSGEFGLPVEPAVLQITDARGVRSFRGATPTMFPVYFLTETVDGNYEAGWRDLAPDDISGISWLYPRKDGLENFFSIKQEARTHARDTSGVPSIPIAGAHVVAWASLSTDDTAERVPLFSTMTGLYQKSSNIQLQGKFNLMGLWKQMELPGANFLYEPSYVFTMNPLTGSGYDRQAPPDMIAEDFDSIQGDFPISYSIYVRESDSFTTNYPSEVYNEFGNVYGIDNYFTGTPLAWDFEKNTVISKKSEKILERMLPAQKPMFGDEDNVCPMNIIEDFGEGVDTDGVLDGIDGLLPEGGGLLGLLGVKGGGGSGGIGGSGGSKAVFTRLNNGLRQFRDTILLKSAVGTACVDLYYHAAPYLAKQLMEHQTLLKLVRGTILVTLRLAQSGILTVILLLMLGGMILKHRPRLQRIKAAVAAIVLVLMLFAATAFAGQLPIPTEALVADSDYVFTGVVTSAEGRLGRDNRIYTDVVVKVNRVVKGQLNKDSKLTFSVIGGKHGNIVTAVTSVPNFKKGDRALLYLKYTERFGLVPFGGYRSKTPIIVDPETNMEVLISDGTLIEDEAPAPVPAEEEKDGDEGGQDNKSLLVPPQESGSGLIPLNDYLRYLQAVVNSQR
ncbi:MAG: CFI-box-CTERM domain-containing protein [Candidatus Hydrogenedentales bacterium]